MLTTIVPELTTRFDLPYIVMEKWQPKKPLTAVYWEGEKERYYVKRFFVDNQDKEENIISDHPKSQLELISTDYIPVLEIVYRKARGKEQRPNDEINLEEFISIKGIKAQGNQLTTESVTQLNLLEPIASAEEETEEIPEVKNETGDFTQNIEKGDDEDKSQTKLFDD